MKRSTKRLSDTVGLVREGAEPGESHSLSVRRIENGHITTVSTCNPRTNEYRSSEVFTKSPPKISPPRIDGRQASAGSESLGDTMSYLKDE